MYSQRTRFMVQLGKALAVSPEDNTHMILEQDVTKYNNEYITTNIETTTETTEKEPIEECPSVETAECFQKCKSIESLSKHIENNDSQEFEDSETFLNNTNFEPVTNVENKIDYQQENPASISSLNRNIEENASQVYEDSDDSVNDRHYEPHSSDASSDDDINVQQNNIIPLSEITENINNDNISLDRKGRPKKGRKSKYGEQNRNQRKKSKNSNQQYYSAKGKLVQPKEFVDWLCTCVIKCHEKISVEERRKFFEHYWQLGNYNVQTSFLCAYVKEEKAKRKNTAARNPEKRLFSRVYSIDKTVICRDMFIKTLGISTKRINTALRKVRTLETLDRRGISGGHNKISMDQKNAVIDHISKFPRYISHYCRGKKDEQEFLAVGTTLAQMFWLYKNENTDTVSFASYKKIFLKEFNLKLKKPKKDTCNKCDTYDAKIKNLPEGDEKERASSEHNMHLEEAERARNAMNIDLKNASENDATETLTYDMEKTLPLPRLTTNIIFYKRQLWLYNCGIYGGKESKSVFNLWLEGQAGRGSQEVGSCLMLYIENNISKTVKNLILWSDSCGGQNRNIKMVLMMKCILERSTHLETIRLRFLVSGHSFLPNDSDFGDVECALKKLSKLFSPQDYVEVMETCRKKKPIKVVSMKSEDFIGTEILEKQITNRKKSCEKEKINWLKMKEIKILKNKPYSIFTKTNYEDGDGYTEINIKKGKGRQPETLFSRHLTPLWPHGKPVAEAKLQDIKSYLHLIPSADHPFYLNLIGDDTIEEDVEGYNTNLDFPVEDE